MDRGERRRRTEVKSKSSRCHRCSKKTHGRPKYGRGLCHGYDGLRDTVKERRLWAKLLALGAF